MTAEFGSTFVLSMATLILTASGVCFGYMLRSKCSSVRFCNGCLEVIRDIPAELIEDRILMHAPTNDPMV